MDIIDSSLSMPDARIVLSSRLAVAEARMNDMPLIIWSSGVTVQIEVVHKPRICADQSHEASTNLAMPNPGQLCCFPPISHAVSTIKYPIHGLLDNKTCMYSAAIKGRWRQSARPIFSNLDGGTDPLPWTRLMSFSGILLISMQSALSHRVGLVENPAAVPHALLPVLHVNWVQWSMPQIAHQH